MIGDYNCETEERINTCKACGYVHAQKFNDDEMYYETTQGDAPFIELGVIHKPDNNYYQTYTEENLYACPKCGTVHIEV